MCGPHLDQLSPKHYVPLLSDKKFLNEDISFEEQKDEFQRDQLNLNKSAILLKNLTLTLRYSQTFFKF